MINSLTPEQEELLSIYHDRWLSIGTSTEPADRARAEAAISGLYRLAGKEPPPFVWVDSPLAAVRLLTYIQEFENKWDIDDSEIYFYLVKKLFADSTDLNGKARDNAKDNLPFTAMLAAPILREMGEEFDRIHTEHDFRYFRNYGGQLEAGWVAFYKYCQEIGVEYDKTSTEGLELWSEQAESCGMWFAFDEICVISERPDVMNVEPISSSIRTYQLHSDAGPAMRFRDGFSLYYHHGVRVNQQIVEQPETLTAEQILTEPNAEVRRVMIEKIGYERFMALVNPEVLDEDFEPTGNPRRLLSVELANDPDGVIVVVELQCTTTGKMYYLRVPPTMRTCLQAVAWTADMSPEDYVVLMES
jgi:hypothetical protein